jgi:drug/metabolite transporter (DMT)-like permease
LSKGTPSSRQLKADLALLLVAFIWGTTFTLVKEAIEEGPVWFFLTLRFLTASLILLPFAFRGERWPWRDGLIIGAFLVGGYLTQTFGLRTIEPGRSAFLTGMSVVLVPLIGRLFRWERLGRLDLAGAILAWFGLSLLTGWILRPGEPLHVGDLWTLACAVFFAFHILWIGRFGKTQPVLRLTWLQIAAATVVFSGGTGILEPDSVEATSRGSLFGMSPLFLGAAAFTGIFATALAFLLQVRMQRDTTATHTAIIFSAEPVFAALFSLVVRHELPKLEEAFGGLLILAGILLVQLAVARRAEMNGEGATGTGT